MNINVRYTRKSKKLIAEFDLFYKRLRETKFSNKFVVCQRYLKNKFNIENINKII